MVCGIQLLEPPGKPDEVEVADGESSHRFVGSLGHTSEGDGILSQGVKYPDLIYMRARYYDPAIGRFVSEDPAMQASNWYMYCGDNSINAIDIDGRFFGFIALVMGSGLSESLRSAFGATAGEVLKQVTLNIASGLLYQSVTDLANQEYSGIGTYIVAAATSAFLLGSGRSLGAAVKKVLLANGVSGGVAAFFGHCAAARLMVFEVLVSVALGEGYDQRND